MIKILQAGQTGTTKYLIDMHRVRTRIFRDRMGWNVNVNEMNLEIDEYDLPETIYVLSLDDHEKVVGTWRFLMTDQPSMIRDIWPHYLDSLPIPENSYMCETSRFGVHCEHANALDRQRTVNNATSEMILALIDVCMKCGITDMFTLYDVKIKRLLERIGFKAERISDVIDLEGQPTVTAQFKMDQNLFQNIKGKTGLDSDIQPGELPPILFDKYIQHQQFLHGGKNAIAAE